MCWWVVGDDYTYGKISLFLLFIRRFQRKKNEFSECVIFLQFDIFSSTLGFFFPSPSLSSCISLTLLSPSNDWDFSFWFHDCKNHYRHRDYWHHEKHFTLGNFGCCLIQKVIVVKHKSNASQTSTNFDRQWRWKTPFQMEKGYNA